MKKAKATDNFTTRLKVEQGTKVSPSAKTSYANHFCKAIPMGDIPVNRSQESVKSKFVPLRQKDLEDMKPTETSSASEC